MEQPRDWTDAEIKRLAAVLRDEAEQEIGVFAGAIRTNGYFNADTAPVTLENLHEMETKFREQWREKGIHITSITPPEQGWPIAFYCPICKETTFMLSLWAVKPKDGDYFLIKELCASEEFGHQHNMQMATKKLEFQVHDPLPLPVYPSMMEFTKQMPIEEADKRWPNTPIPEETTKPEGEQP